MVAHLQSKFDNNPTEEHDESKLVAQIHTAGQAQPEFLKPYSVGSHPEAKLQNCHQRRMKVACLRIRLIARMTTLVLLGSTRELTTLVESSVHE